MILQKSTELLFQLPSVPDYLRYSDAVWSSGYFWQDSETSKIFIKRPIVEKCLPITSDGKPAPWRRELTTDAVLCLHHAILQACYKRSSDVEVEQQSDGSLLKIDGSVFKSIEFDSASVAAATVLPDVASTSTFLKIMLLDFIVGLRRTSQEVLYHLKNKEYVFLPSAWAFGYGITTDLVQELRDFCYNYELMKIKFGFEWRQHVDMAYEPVKDWWSDCQRSIKEVLHSEKGLGHKVLAIIEEHLNSRIEVIEQLLKDKELFIGQFRDSAPSDSLEADYSGVFLPVDILISDVLRPRQVKMITVNYLPIFLNMACDTQLDCIKALVQLHTRGHYVAVGFCPLTYAHAIHEQILDEKVEADIKAAQNLPSVRLIEDSLRLVRNKC